MDTHRIETQQRMAFVAGWSLIGMALIAGFAYGYGFNQLYVPNNGSATLANLRQFGALFRWIIISFVVILLLDVIVSWALYCFFRPVNDSLSLLTAWIRIVYASLLGMAIHNLLLVLPATNGIPQNETVVMSHLAAFLTTWSFGLIVFGSHLCLLGWLMMQSGAIPKALSILTLLAGLCYFLNNLNVILLPDYGSVKDTVETILSLPMALGELGLAVWLVAKGRKWPKLAGVS